MSKTNTIPSQIIDYSIYNGSTSTANKLIGHGAEMDLATIKNICTTVDLPSGEMDLPAMRTENIEQEITFNIFSNEATTNISLTKPVHLIIRGAKQEVNTDSHELGYSGLKVTVKGFPSEISLGKLKRADKMDSKIKLNLTYIKVESGNEELIEIDKLNGTYKINGVDMRAGISNYL